MKKLCFVYIMTNKYQTVFYTGVTGNLSSRVRQHEKGEVQGFTKKYNCTDLIYYEKYIYIDKAIEREKQIKKYSRPKKKVLIESLNPHHKRLNEQVYAVDEEYL